MTRTNWLLSGLLVLASSGCALPVYHEPGGYSSTWQGRMNESHVDWPEPAKKSELAGVDLPSVTPVTRFFSSVTDACRPSSWPRRAGTSE